MKLKRAYSILDVKSIDDEVEYWTVKGTASTPTPDRMGDIVDPLGASYAESIPLLWQHMSSQPVGHAMLGKSTKKGIPFTARLPKVKEEGPLKERIELAIQSVKYRLVAAVSIGFRVVDDAIEYLEGSRGFKFLKTEIMELSLVTIPANMEATIASVKSLVDDTDDSDSDDDVAAATGKPVVVNRTTIMKAGDTAKANPIRPKEKGKVKIKEQLAAFEAKRAAHAARMEELMSKASDEDRVLDDEEQEDYDTLSAELQGVDKHLVRLRDLERFQAEKATPVTGIRTVAEGSAARGNHPIVTGGNTVLPKGMEFARYVRCLVIARGDPMRAYEIAKEHFRDNHRVHNVLKAAITAGTTTDPAWAGALVEYQTLASEFVEFLRPQTIIGKFGTNGIPPLRAVPFNVRMGAQTSGGSGYWVGEGKPKPLTKFAFEAQTLGWAKVANIAVLTDELVRFSNPSADSLVQQALADALRERLDIDFIDPDKAEVPNVSPASITNGVTPIPSSGTDADSARADIEAMFQEFIDANMAPSTGVWITSTGNALALSMMQNALGQAAFPGVSMNGGTFAGLPVITSEYVTQVSDTGETMLILVNANDIYLADDGGITIDASREASLQMDDAPTNNSDVPAATALVSMFQTNSVALKAERMINWKKRRPGSVQYIEGPAYTSASAATLAARRAGAPAAKPTPTPPKTPPAATHPVG